ncbi:MAG: flagellar basal-body MS-ring/collar protein FliF, partial [Phycisphaerae bacterium]|nr:flagellar basal-body MS-ring/collar protein FliF [Phycisphaerae bacterium]
LMDIFNRINAIWQNIGLVQRALLISAVITAIAVSGLVAHWVSKPDMRLLYGDLAPEQASKIADKINEKAIAYELRSGGTAIYVPSDQLYQLRLDMARDGLTGSDKGGYKLFDNEKIGISPFVQNINLKRALEDEIARSIQMIEGVITARVHLVNSKQKIFDSQTDNTSASVVLKLQAGYKLSGVNVAAISHLVAGSVEGLDIKNVTVIDSHGRLLTGGSEEGFAGAGGTVQDYKERVEQALSAKVEEMLTMALGPDRAKVKISAIVDTTSLNQVTETYDPAGKVPTKEEVTSNSETQAAKLSSDGQPTGTGGMKKDETVMTEYAVGKIVEQRTELPGKVQSLSVAAFVDLSVSDANAAADAKILPLSDVEEIIKNAVGLKNTDTLKVVDVKFNRPVVQAVEEPADFSGYISLAKQLSLGLTGICALLVFKIFAKGTKPPVQIAGQLSAGGGEVARLPAADGATETMMLRNQIASALRSNPDQARQVFTKWLEEKEN